MDYAMYQNLNNLTKFSHSHFSFSCDKLRNLETSYRVPSLTRRSDSVWSWQHGRNGLRGCRWSLDSSFFGQHIHLLLQFVLSFDRKTSVPLLTNLVFVRLNLHLFLLKVIEMKIAVGYPRQEKAPPAKPNEGRNVPRRSQGRHFRY